MKITTGNSFSAGFEVFSLYRVLKSLALDLWGGGAVLAERMVFHLPGKLCNPFVVLRIFVGYEVVLEVIWNCIGKVRVACEYPAGP